MSESIEFKESKEFKEFKRFIVIQLPDGHHYTFDSMEDARDFEKEYNEKIESEKELKEFFEDLCDSHGGIEGISPVFKKPEDRKNPIIDRDIKKFSENMRDLFKSTEEQHEDEEFKFDKLISRYHRPIKTLDKVIEDENTHWVDVYAVLEAFNVKDQAIGHAIKKLLDGGNRGVKSERQDWDEAILSIQAALNLKGY